eukprot:scaffold27984_cov113-Isochrysis_galbana.AAC.10
MHLAAHLASKRYGAHAGRWGPLPFDAPEVLVVKLGQQLRVDQVRDALRVGEVVREPLGAAAAHTVSRRVADDPEQRLLRHATHVGVCPVAARRRKPEAGVMVQVAVPFHREETPGGALADVGHPSGTVRVRRVAHASGHRTVGREVDSDHSVMRVDLRAQAGAQQIAARADDGARVVIATGRVTQLTQHLQRRSAVRAGAQRPEAVWRVARAQSLLVGMLDECRGSRRWRSANAAWRHGRLRHCAPAGAVCRWCEQCL